MAFPSLRALSWRFGLLWSGMLLLAFGFCAQGMWRGAPWKHACEVMGIAVAAVVIAAALNRLWRAPLADRVLVVFALALLLFAGLVPTLAALLLGTAALGLGHAAGGKDGVSSMIIGLGLIAGAIGWLLPFPLHVRSVYLLVLLLIAVLTRRHIRVSFAEAMSAWRHGVDADPAAAAFAALVAGIASIGCWIPTVQFDDLAYHLGLPSQLQALGYYRMDAQTQFWALAPWSGDIVQAVVQLLAGTEARGAVDALWLAATLSLVWQLAVALGMPARACWLSVALVASQPMTAALAGGMQAELPATAVVLALALVAVRADAHTRDGLPLAVLSGLLLGLKPGFVALLLPLLLCWLWWRRPALAPHHAVAAVLLACFVGASSYVYAYALTGNPLFPILNNVFHSPLLAEVNLHDPRWNAPVSWDLPWRLTFLTSEYAESWNGTAGFSLLALIGAVPVALMQRNLRGLALTGVLAFVAALATVHYFRYGYPALTLLTPCLVAAVFAGMSARNGTILLVVTIALNVAYQGASVWTLYSGAITREVMRFSRTPVYATFAPERLLAASVREQDPDAHIVFTAWERPFIAELAGGGFSVAGYDPRLQGEYQAAEKDPSGAGWRALFAHTGARYAMTFDDDFSPALRTALADAKPLQRLGKSQSWRLPAGRTPLVDLQRERDAAAAHFRP